MAKKKTKTKNKKKKAGWNIEIKNMKKFWIVMACVFGVFIILGAINRHFDYLSFIMLMMCLTFIFSGDKEK